MAPVPDGGSAPDDGGDRLDAIFHVVADPRRRFLLSRLEAGAGPLTVSGAAAAITAWENGGTEGSPGEVRAVEVSLHHVHLPKLVAADLVAYDAEAGTIRRGRRAPEAERHIADA